MPSQNFIRQAYNGGGDPLLTLLRVNVDGVNHYFVNNTEDITSTVSGSSQTYQKGMFNLSLPDDTSEGTPTASLDFDAADIQIIRTLRKADIPIVIDLWVVLASNPNYAEYGPANFESVSTAISEQSVKLSLVAEPILDIQLPAASFTPNTAPGLWETR